MKKLFEHVSGNQFKLAEMGTGPSLPNIKVGGTTEDVTGAPSPVVVTINNGMITIEWTEEQGKEPLVIKTN